MKRSAFLVALWCTVAGCGDCGCESRTREVSATPSVTSQPPPPPARPSLPTLPAVDSPCNVLASGASTDAPRRLAYRDSCISDSWPETTLTCFAQAATPEAELTCANTLDEARQDWLRYRVGVAEGRAAGWACLALESVLREAQSCPRMQGADIDPFPEMQLALENARAAARAAPNEATQRTTELRCLSLERLALGHMASLPCLDPQSR